jgi:hypothetical protein
MSKVQLDQCFSTGGPHIVSKESAGWVDPTLLFVHAVLLYVLSFFIAFLTSTLE